VVVLTTSTLNRVMVVELALPALLPGLLVALHYAVQILRPRMGFGSDVGGRRTPWILGGMALLACGGVSAAAATAWMASSPLAGMLLAALSFTMIGVGVSAAGTTLLVLLATSVDDARRAPAATLVWIMMIVGFAVTAGLVGRFLDPYSPVRLLGITATVSAVAMVLSTLALLGLETGPGAAPPAPSRRTPFRQALAEVWREPRARRFTVFIFVSMLAFSAQDLILEPFAGLVFAYTPGQTTSLSGLQHGGVLAGMLLVAAACGPWARGHGGAVRTWVVGGCLVSALALGGLVVAGFVGPGWPLATNVFLLGAANGAFSIAAIGSMMRLASDGRERREGVRMGLWGAAQALAFGSGGLIGSAASDVARAWLGSPGLAYASVFGAEALLFVLSAWLALRIDGMVSSRTVERRLSPVAVQPGGNHG
jgi:BCD family chlorophyll transporter-like MFS transporter